MRVWPQPLTASGRPTRVCVQRWQLTLPAQLNHTVNTSRLPDFFSPRGNFYAGGKKRPKRGSGFGGQICRWGEEHAQWAVAASSFLPQSCQRQ